MPECQKYENGGLDQYVAEPFAQQRFGTSGIEGGECLHLLDRVYDTVTNKELYVKLPKVHVSVTIKAQLS